MFTLKGQFRDRALRYSWLNVKRGTPIIVTLDNFEASGDLEKRSTALRKMSIPLRGSNLPKKTISLIVRLE